MLYSQCAPSHFFLQVELLNPFWANEMQLPPVKSCLWYLKAKLDTQIWQSEVTKCLHSHQYLIFNFHYCILSVSIFTNFHMYSDHFSLLKFWFNSKIEISSYIQVLINFQQVLISNSEVKTTLFLILYCCHSAFTYPISNPNNALCIFLKLIINSILHGEIHNFSCWSHDKI